MKKFIVIGLMLAVVGMSRADIVVTGEDGEEIVIPRDSVPDDHLGWFALRGPVKEVIEYNYADWRKTVWRFDTQGRLVLYEDYGNPFAGNGGCVFSLTNRYRYAYDEEGKIQFLETYDEVNSLVDAYADMILELFPPQTREGNWLGKAHKEYGDSTRCFSEWKDIKNLQHYFGCRYDRYGNWIERADANLDDASQPSVRVREIRYYKEIELFDLPVGVKAIVHRHEADGRLWGNRYDFDQEGTMTAFRSWVDDEILYEWDVKTDDEPGSNFIAPGAAKETDREVYYWTTVPVGELKALPEGMNEENAFGLCFDYMGYAFEGSLYPLHNGWWVVLSYWCLDEMDEIYLEDEEGGEPVPAASRYHDPFAGMRYPIIWTDSIGFMTRNYSDQTIPLYEYSYGKKVRSKLKKQCSMRVLDADPSTRRLFCTTEDDQSPVCVGWIDEEWVCANLLSTCP